MGARVGGDVKRHKKHNSLASRARTTPPENVRQSVFKLSGRLYHQKIQPLLYSRSVSVFIHFLK